jgi:hypothetical protein
VLLIARGPILSGAALARPERGQRLRLTDGQCSAPASRLVTVGSLGGCRHVDPFAKAST